MQTSISAKIRNTSWGLEAERILRTCVHCGFCNATCPTYRLLGDELDGPRGRIYLIKQSLEGQTIGARSLKHLDRCLTCRSCETTCPSGVRYGELLDIGRRYIEHHVRRPATERIKRRLLRLTVPYRRRFHALLTLGRILRPLLPATLKRNVPAARDSGSRPQANHARRMLVLEGCVQPAIAPDINTAAAQVLDRLGVSLIRETHAGCCGALSHHLNAHREARKFMRRNIDAWWPHVQAGAEALMVTASACGVMIKDYGRLLRDDPAYAGKAARISRITRDISEVLAQENLAAIRPRAKPSMRIAFHSPCTLQHGLGLQGKTEALLRELGYTLTQVSDGHLCCGSAGTYSLLQPVIAQRLLHEKLDALQADRPDLIVTANIGCLAHLQSRAGVPVRHWVSLLAEHA